MHSDLHPFAFYGIQVSFFPDEAALRKTFLELSRKHHPDFFPYDTPEHEEALHYSDLNNKAYQVLGSFDSRLKFILEHHGLLVEGEKNILPQDFLLEMLDLNDLIDEAHAGDPSARAQAEELLKTNLDGIREHMERHARSWDEDHEHKHLAALHVLYQQYRYLLRLEHNFVQGVE